MGKRGTPVNSPLDDISDAREFLTVWKRAVQLQLVRLASTSDISIDAHFAIVALSRLVRTCHMFEAHDVPGVQVALQTFERRQPLERPLRNAAEHFDEYLRGQGRSASGTEWFVYRTERVDGEIYMTIPPLDDHEATTVDLTQMLLDAGRLAEQVEIALHKGSRARVMTALNEKRRAARDRLSDAND